MIRLRTRLLPAALLIALFHLSTTGAAAQPATMVRALLERAADRFDIPRPILYGIAYTESRWRFLVDEDRARACNGMPPAIGVMGLHDDDYFGHSLAAATGIGLTPAEASIDLDANITAGAYYLSTLFDGAERDDPAAWLPAVARYPGIPQPELRALYVDGFLELLRRGWTYEGGAIPPYDLAASDRAAIAGGLARLGVTAGVPDYPGATWQPSPNFSSRDNTQIIAITIHDTEGEFAGSLSWLLSTESEASAHYIIRSVDGFMVQMVAESDKAWHVRTENPYTIGIEHEGFAATPSYFTPPLYSASAALVRYLMSRYGIPLDRTRIKGHLDFPNNTHTDPGGWWDWPDYYRLIAGKADLAVPIDRFEDTVVGWWQPSLSGSTVGVDTAATTFAITAAAAAAGASGAELRYSFTDAAGGIARVFRSGHGNTSDGLLNLGQSTTISLMVQGDGSGNAIEIWLYDSTKGNVVLPLGSIDWSGWRKVSASLAGLPGPRPLRFHSVVLRQTAGGNRSGRIGLDELTAERGISAVPVAIAATPLQAQPSAAIALQAEESLHAALEISGPITIFDATGSVVAIYDRAPDTAIGTYLRPGVYFVTAGRIRIKLAVLP